MKNSVFHSRQPLFRWIYTLAALAFFAAVWFDLYTYYQNMLGAHSFSIVLCILFLVIGLTGFTIWKPTVLPLPILRRWRMRLGWARWGVVFLIGAAVGLFFTFSAWSQIFSGLYTRIFIFACCAIGMAWFATHGSEKNMDWNGLLAGTTLLCGIYTIITNFRYVSNYPFTLYWSEGNRFWDYSILFGRSLYNYPADQHIPAFIDFGRQSLWGVIFLLPNVSILGMRIWDAIVVTLPALLLGGILFYQPRQSVRWLLLGLWAATFLNQGPIYSTLILAAILVALAWRLPTFPAMLIVGLAGYYAYYSRSTWVLAPAIWSAMLAIVDAPPLPLTRKTLLPFIQTLAVLWKHWGRAFLLAAAGLSGSLLFPKIIPPLLRLLQSGSQTVTVPPASAPQVIQSASTLTTVYPFLSLEWFQFVLTRQPLLWFRLLPNDTFPTGILLGLLIAITPLFIALICCRLSRGWKLDLWQKLVLSGVLLAFLGVGVIISVKIGGGSNLHNLDMFLISLLLTAGLAWKAGLKDWLADPQKRSTGFNLVLLAAILLPTCQLMLLDTIRMQTPPASIVSGALRQVQTTTAAYKEKGEILFIDQRQLLTFGTIQNVPLVPQYEKKRLMDEALSGNSAFFEPFYRDLASHRFSLIISEVLAVKSQESAYNFGDENNAWIQWVSGPVLCFYESLDTLPEVGIQLLVPRSTPWKHPTVDCPNP